MDLTGNGVAYALWVALLALFPLALGVAYLVSGVYLSDGDRVAFFGWGWTTLAWSLSLLAVAAGAWPVLARAAVTRGQVAGGLLALAWLWATSVTAVHSPNFSALYAGQITAMGALACTTYAMVKCQGWGFARAVLGAWVVGALLYLISVAWLYVLVGEVLDFQWSQRLPGFYNVRPAGYLWEMALAIGLGAVVATPGLGAWRLWSARGGLVLLWAVLFWSGGRAHALSLLLSGAVLGLCVPPFRQRLAWEVGGTASVGALWSLTWWTPPNGSFGLWNALSRSLQAGDLDAATSARLSLWRDVWHLFLEQPWWGHGVAQYQDWTRLGMGGTYHAHNWVLDALFSWGLPGGAAWVGLVAWCVRLGWCRVRRAPSAIHVAAAWGLWSLVVHGFFSGTLFYAHSQMMFATLMGVLIATHKVPLTRTDAHSISISR
jgi:O-antigen ligase